MNITDFDFELPDILIAQHPTAKRDHSNLLICKDNSIKKTKFHNIADLIGPDDLLIFNNSKVINAQLNLEKNNSKIHVNLNRELEENLWTGFAKPARKLKVGDEFYFNEYKIIITEKGADGVVIFKFEIGNLTIVEFLDKYGHVPLPPYIKRQEDIKDDKSRYQSVLAKKEGSVAAPTASLHFTKDLLQKIKNNGAEIVEVTLHVGAGTFLPVKVDNIEEHVMHSEYASITEVAANKINEAKSNGKRIIAVGTTAMRTIESFSNGSVLEHGTKETSIFIKPGHKFHIPDILITNFHLPRSTLFMLVCAFAGYDEMRSAYEYAIENEMRFLSYGDAMMLHKK